MSLLLLCYVIASFWCYCYCFIIASYCYWISKTVGEGTLPEALQDQQLLAGFRERQRLALEKAEDGRRGDAWVTFSIGKPTGKVD